MGTTNFYYINRCIIITDDDYECGNYPALGEINKNALRSYPSNYIEGTDFLFHNIFITSGYYADACLDYDINDINLEYFLGGTQYYYSQKEFFKDCKDNFNLSEYRLRKICGNMGDTDLETYLEACYEKILDYLRAEEEVEVNKYLDKIKEEYGYEEIRLAATFSNGEGYYEKIC